MKELNLGFLFPGAIDLAELRADRGEVDATISTTLEPAVTSLTLIGVDGVRESIADELERKLDTMPTSRGFKGQREQVEHELRLARAHALERRPETLRRISEGEAEFKERQSHLLDGIRDLPREEQDVFGQIANALGHVPDLLEIAHELGEHHLSTAVFTPKAALGVAALVRESVGIENPLTVDVVGAVVGGVRESFGRNFGVDPLRTRAVTRLSAIK